MRGFIFRDFFLPWIGFNRNSIQHLVHLMQHNFIHTSKTYGFVFVLNSPKERTFFTGNLNIFSRNFIQNTCKESNEESEKKHSKHPANKYFKKTQIFSFTKLNVEELPKNYIFSW